jgi:hypothetical protein
MPKTKTVTVRIVDVPATTQQGYRWQWRAADRKVRSSRQFDLFYECVEDARARGYEVDLSAGRRGRTAPGT